MRQPEASLGRSHNDQSDSTGGGGVAEDEFAQAFEQFRGLIDAERIDALQPLGPGAVDTALVTVWLLVDQRLQADGTRADAVHE